jgi:hypothetical protein
MISSILEDILTHPKEVCLSYYEHLCLSLNLSYILYKGSIKAIIHAILPFVYIKSTTNLINEIDNILKKNKCNEEIKSEELIIENNDCSDFKRTDSELESEYYEILKNKISEKNNGLENVESDDDCPILENNDEYSINKKID